MTVYVYTPVRVQASLECGLTAKFTELSKPQNRGQLSALLPLTRTATPTDNELLPRRPCRLESGLLQNTFPAAQPGVEASVTLDKLPTREPSLRTLEPS